MMPPEQFSSPDVSVVVIGRNEGQRLVDCLQSVRAADWSGMVYELIYVDSGSYDDSPAKAAALGAHVLQVHPVLPNAALGRNEGWRAARAPLVMFLDGDTLLHPGFVPTALAALRENPGRAAVWGHRRERFPERSVFNQVLDLDWVYAPGETAFCGGDALFQRVALVEVSGFNDTLIAGEEPELCARLRERGWQIWHLDAPMTLHDLAITRWRQYWLRAERAGHAYAEVSNRFAYQAAPLWRREKMRNLLHSLILLLYLISILATISTGAWAALCGLLCGGVAAAARSAWRARWKGGSPAELCLYALHSHLQQLPIAWGQLKWWLAHTSGVRRGLIDYKGAQK